MAFISYGRIDKKLILLVFITIVRTINIFVSEYDNTSNGMLCSFEDEIGAIIAGVILHFIFRHKMSKSGKEKRSIKHLLILLLFRAIKSSYERIFPFFVTNSQYRFRAILNTTNGLEIIVITGGTFLMLNYKYHIHHIISMIVFCALGISIDIIIKSFSIHFDFIYIYIIFILNEVLVYCYLKYMMDKLYYQYTEIIFYWGLMGLIVKLFIFSGLSLHEYINDIDGYIFKVRKYFTETDLVSIVFLQFFYYLLDGGVYFSLIALLLFYLRPNHMIITDEIHVYLEIILFKDKPNKAYSIIPFVFQILALLFYFEILEFNFCGLNKNTSKNIEARGDAENNMDTSDSNKIELDNQYILKSFSLKDEDDSRNSLSNSSFYKSNSINDDDYELFKGVNSSGRPSSKISQKNKK